jgi:transcriptional regulator with XRE-family HTH domain
MAKSTMTRYAMDAKKLGQIIRHNREKQSVTLSTISDNTTISVEELTQIECGEATQIEHALKVLSLLALDVMVVSRRYRESPEYIGFQRLRVKDGEITPQDQR